MGWMRQVRHGCWRDAKENHSRYACGEDEVTGDIIYDEVDAGLSYPQDLVIRELGICNIQSLSSLTLQVL